MPGERQVYLLDPQELSPEAIAVAFAKTSRSPQSFRQIAAELTDEKTADFHERWVVGYGHASVAEHAVLHVAVENLSRLAVEALESNRLASYTEKSTRYQKWGGEEFYTPPELDDAELKALYQRTLHHLFDAYQQALPRVRQVVEQDQPRQEGESEAAWERRIRSDYVDVCRYLLPAASLANVGMTINARNLEHALCKMLSHPLAEVRQMGEEIRQVAAERVPTLIKYVRPLPYLEGLEEVFSAPPASSAPQPEDWCWLADFDPQIETRVLAAALYRFGLMDYRQALEGVAQASSDQRAAWVERLVGCLDAHDIPLRELEHANYLVDVTLDQGAYFELKRHRMMTQTPQALTTRLGYAVPKRLLEAGFEREYDAAMDAAKAAYERLANFNPDVAAYVVPNAFNRRVLLSFNLRTAYHWLALRSTAGAHFAMRRVARRVAQEIQTATPTLAAFLRLPAAESWYQIEQEYFVETARK